MSAGFVVPDDAQFLREFGLPPAPVDEREPWLRAIDVRIDDSESLHISFDQVAGSVRFEWTASGRVMCSVYREKATVLSLVTENRSTKVCVAFDSAELSGILRVQVYPHVRIEDSLLVG